MSVLATKHRAYAVVSEGINSLRSLLPKTSVLITDQTLNELYGNGLGVEEKILIPCGEKAKTIETATQCWQQLHELGCDRHTTLVALGGGAVTDLTGFVGACYMRGIATIYIPTTLLGMVDASIGGKTGVNLGTGKSIVGAFHQPKHVYILPELLKTLPENQFRSGLAEVIKYGVVWDAELFNQLEIQGPEPIMNIIERCCRIKAEIVSRDEKEQNLRAILNYGHTFAHAIETLTEYKRYLHGEAVAIGMALAAKVAKEVGWVDASFVQRQNALIQKFGLPTELPSDINVEALIRQMEKDKKAVNRKINLILPKEIGTVAIYIDADEFLLRKVLIQ